MNDEERARDPRRIAIFVPGINQWPNNARNWNWRAATWVNTNRPSLFQDSLYYFCLPISRAFHQWRRARRLAELLKAYSGWSITLTGHSNGTDIICKALRMLRESRMVKIKRLNLACGACPANFQNNGLNLALSEYRVEKVVVYVAGRDKALKLAHSWIGKLLGYGTLGLHGPVNVLEAVKDRTVTERWPRFGHSDCFHPMHFVATLNQFLWES